VQSLARRLENGGVLTCAGVSQAAQPFFAALLRKISRAARLSSSRQPQDTGKFSTGPGDVALVWSKSRASRVKGKTVPALDLRPSTFDRCSIPPGTCCHTKANSRMPTPSATGSKRWLPCHLTQHATRNTRHWSSPASLRFCKKLFPPVKFKNATRTLARGDKLIHST